MIPLKITVLCLVCGMSVVRPERAFADGTEPLARGDVLIVTEATPLLQLVDGELRRDCLLPCRTWLRGDSRGLAMDEPHNADRRLLLAWRQTNDGWSSGWISQERFVNVTKLRAVIRGRGTAFPAFDDVWEDLPAVIARQPRELQRAWLESTQAVEENSKLPPEEQSPTPWLARGEVLAIAGNYHDALEDYVRAAGIVRSNGGDRQNFVTAFVSLEKVLSRLRQNPSPPVVAEATEEWERGFYSYRRGDLATAAQAFQNATALAPGEAVFWYFRALNHRHIGLPERALHHARIGAWLESRSTRHSPRRLTASIDRRLERIQGSDRRWLQQVRRGFHADPAPPDSPE